MPRFNFGGSVNSTSGSTSYPYNHVYSDYGAGFPTTNLDINGNRPIYVGAVGSDYAAGAAGIHTKISRGGTPTPGGGGLTFPTSGGGFRFEIHYATGTLSFGRNTGNGVSTYDAADGYGWGGGLCGWFDWAGVPAKPGISASRTGKDVKVTVTAPGDNGGMGVTAYIVQMWKSGGAWGTDRSGGTTTYTNLTPGVYEFRVWCGNGVGSSQIAYSGQLTVPDVPGVPGAVTQSRDARSVTSSVAASASNGGATITSYEAQISADGGTTWSASTTVTPASRSTVYPDLVAGKSYITRWRAKNEIGTSAWSTSSAIFVPAGGTRWDATTGQWIPCAVAERWDAPTGQWVDLTVAERWDAPTGQWVNLG